MSIGFANAFATPEIRFNRIQLIVVTGEWMAPEDHPRDLRKYRILDTGPTRQTLASCSSSAVRESFCFAVATSAAMVSKEPVRVSDLRDIGEISKWQ
jgi:hypothetical protein